MKLAVAIMVKQPQAGGVKTRLCPPLRPEQAADLYHCFLVDKMAQVRRAAAAARYLAYTPPEAEGFFRELAGEGFSLIPQEGEGLGSRLASLAARLLAVGHPAAVIIDSDTPSLPDRFLVEAVSLLRGGRVDAVFGPAEDGGYYLVGLRRPAPSLFEDIAWSTASVLDQTLARVAAAGLTVRLIPAWYDVDTGPDLERLRRDLARNGTAAEQTRAFLRDLRIQGPPRSLA
ncbi:MAG TPA: TIGR04282 family arsenosugar biosynthesis glycosyltransferase [Candidatus Methylomirabilis sp.]|nr:TIGR04282 family arsenosugar biosynthesis glycosyltransferase [Candidatus Methylomirabilis sp.]